MHQIRLQIEQEFTQLVRFTVLVNFLLGFCCALCNSLGKMWKNNVISISEENDLFKVSVKKKMGQK